IAYLRDTKDLDETGYLEDDHFVLEGDIALTQADIRQFHLAKSALRAGLATLIAQSGIRREDIGQLFLAGGLGCFLSIENAAKVGLLPPDLKNVTVAVGNSALYGGVEVLLCPQKIKDIEGYIAKCKIVELQNHPFFADAYMEHMFFPDTE
ncbi:MAG: DUF4445 domain-containing protein, partial [Clostridia bacterium]|nr:DUF4445 domain-containing protein [Clostridia bacterium]